MHLTRKNIVVALAAAWGLATSHAAQWEAIVTAGSDRVEIDKARIMRTPTGRTTAWSRIPLAHEAVDAQGIRYTVIEALNRYDCGRRSFATVRRVYRLDERKVREEPVIHPRELAAEPGSVDERLLTEACKPRTVGEAKDIADQATRLALEAQAARPAPMYADMRSAAEGGAKTKTLPVADTAPARPAEKAAEKAPEKAAEAKPADRPRFIELPKIDKSQLEEASKPAPAAKAAEAKAPSETKPAPEVKQTAAKVVEPKLPPSERPAASRQELERLYATSGPRKAKKKSGAAEHEHIHWGYEGEGAPANWSKLDPKNALCDAGKRQSPIDIRDGVKVDLEAIKFDYRPTPFRVVDNGHTIQVNLAEGMNSLRVMDRQFNLIQFHFHRPSEERVNGKPFDMVVHLVHKDDNGKLGVLAVLLEKGSEHALIQTVWNYLPLDQGQDVTPGALLDLNQLLPERRAYYTYMGSLTTPPCSEEVLWMVFKQPVQVSPQQVSVFARLYPNNARPVQPSNSRLVKESR